MDADVSMVFSGYVVRHLLPVRLGIPLKEIIAKVMAEVEKNREQCSALIVPQEWIPMLRSLPEAFGSVNLRTGYVGTFFGAELYIDNKLVQDEMVIFVHSDIKIVHFFRLQIEGI